MEDWFKFRKEHPDKSEEELEQILRDRLITMLKETKITQREVSRETKIPESALSQWKNHKPIGFEKWGSGLEGDRICPTTLYLSSKEAILNFLEDNGY